MKKLISSVVALSLLSALLTGCNVVTNTLAAPYLPKPVSLLSLLSHWKALPLFFE